MAVAMSGDRNPVVVPKEAARPQIRPMYCGAMSAAPDTGPEKRQNSAIEVGFACLFSILPLILPRIKLLTNQAMKR